MNYSLEKFDIGIKKKSHSKIINFATFAKLQMNLSSF